MTNLNVVKISTIYSNQLPGAFYIGELQILGAFIIEELQLPNAFDDGES